MADQIDFTADQERVFREQIRSFVRENLSDSLREKAAHIRPVSKDESVHRALQQAYKPKNDR